MIRLTNGTRVAVTFHVTPPGYTFDAFGSCGEHLTQPIHQPSSVEMSVEARVLDGPLRGQVPVESQFELKRHFVGSDPYIPFTGFVYPPRFTWNAPEPGIYGLRATARVHFPGIFVGGLPTVVFEEAYFVPLRVVLTVFPAVDSSGTRVPVVATVGALVPSTFKAMFCAVRDDGLVVTRYPPQTVNPATGARIRPDDFLLDTGTWRFYVLVYSFDWPNDPDAAASAQGEQIVFNYAVP